MNELIAWHHIKSELGFSLFECHQIEISRLQDHRVRNVLDDVVGQLRQFLCQNRDLIDRVLDESVSLSDGCQLEAKPQHLLPNLAVLCVT